jgi:hypothetical protein
MRISSVLLTINDPSNDYDTLIKGDGDAVLFSADAGLDRIGIGRTLGTHGAKLDVDNKTAAIPIFLARDNGTGVFIIGDGGAVGVNTATAPTPTAGFGTLGLNGTGGGDLQFLVNNVLGANVYYDPAGDGLGLLTVSTEDITLATNSTERLVIDSNGNVVINETGANADIRAEGDTDANLLTLDASADSVAVGVALGSHTSKFHIGGSVSLPIASTTSASFTLTSAHCVLLCDATSNNINVNLPAASACAGRHYCVKKTNATNTVTVDPNSTEQIDGATTAVITTINTAIWFVSDGAAWWIL